MRGLLVRGVFAKFNNYGDRKSKRGERMKKFAVFSGFLGSGKTTAMMALTHLLSAKYGKAAMITNDLGGQGLADDRFRPMLFRWPKSMGGK